MFVFGGTTTSNIGYSNEMFIFKLDSRAWQTVEMKGMIPEPRANHVASINSEGLLVIFGGYVGTKMDYSNEIFEFDINEFIWYKPLIKGPIPEARESASMNLIRGMLWVFGGYARGKTLNNLFVLNTDSLTWIKAET